MTTSQPQIPAESDGPVRISPGKLHTDLAPWWHLLSPPEEYAAAADFYWKVIQSACPTPPRTLLELGSGGGNNASFLKRRCKITLVDLSPRMLRQSQTLNPECEHLTGDMRTIRLGRVFDAVFIHDAISFMLTAADLERAIQTAFVHCRPGGAALFAPDHVRETLRSSTSHGGHDSGGRGMRYLEWIWDPDPGDSTYLMDFAYLLRDGNGEVRVESDRLQLGVFSRADWLGILLRVGFEPSAVPYAHSEGGLGAEVFLGRKPV
ncbi:MAG: class I SAM-dependent methyltransferase [Opitutus sp.]|nr:class I SAM-dependent methyltransferase [Opitutus sp.]